MGHIINKVKNKARPARTWFGGEVCVWSAARIKWSTTMILVNEVSITRSAGAIARTVRTRNILTVAESDAFCPSKVREKPPVLVVEFDAFGAYCVEP